MKRWIPARGMLPRVHHRVYRGLRASHVEVIMRRKTILPFPRCTPGCLPAILKALITTPSCDPVYRLHRSVPLGCNAATVNTPAPPLHSWYTPCLHYHSIPLQNNPQTYRNRFWYNGQNDRFAHGEQGLNRRPVFSLGIRNYLNLGIAPSALWTIRVVLFSP